ncbi:GABA permease [Actinobaculum suis]|uniref:GABA permease n=1 Tax=Actinobaculum suis TaxID=1657 RepID=A0A7Z8YAB7_9ACTO|nr:amino acid permease [Actinobaculum suis]VDG76964.1 GABA permease [Actinobaculum suis]
MAQKNLGNKKAGMHTELSRQLTSPQIAMIALSGALGTGLFLGAGSTIQHAGPATVISYMLAGSLALAVVWALAELVSAHPVPGGHGTVAASYLGRFGGYLTRWNFAVTMLVAVGAEVTASAKYLHRWLPWLDQGLGTVLCSLFIVSLNLATVRLYGTSEYWFSMIKVVAISVFILLGLVIVFFGLPEQEPIGFVNLTAHDGFMPYGVPGILAAACMAVFSFGGIENVSVSAAESQHPERDIPRAAHTMIWRLLLFYVGAILVVVMIQPWTVTAQPLASIEQSPFVIALDAAGIPGAGHIMNAVLLVAALSAANGCLYSSSRMIHALAIDGMAPAFAARSSAHGAPRGAVLIATLGMVIASVLAIVSPDAAFSYLYGCATVGILVTWVLTMLTHLAFRRRRTQLGLPDAPARLWGAPVVPVLVIVASIAIFVALFWLIPVAWYAGIPYLVLLSASYLLVRRSPALAPVRDLAAEEYAELHGHKPGPLSPGAAQANARNTND